MMRKFNSNDYENVSGGIVIYDPYQHNSNNDTTQTLIIKGYEDIKSFGLNLLNQGRNSKNSALEKNGKDILRIGATLEKHGLKPELQVNFCESSSAEFISAATELGINNLPGFKKLSYHSSEAGNLF